MHPGYIYMSNKFCPLPWIFQAVRNNGDVRVCCQANPSQSKGIYRKPDGTAYNAIRDDLDASRNSDVAKAVRSSMLLNQVHEACIRCDKEEESGIESRRQYERVLWNDRFSYEDAVSKTQADGTIDTSEIPVRYYDLRFGNLCNLKCRMCGPTDSNQWYEDHVKVWNTTSFNDSHGKVELTKNAKNRWVATYNDYDWFESDSFWEQVDKNIPNIEQIHTVGGEPLMINKHYDLLKRCVDTGYAKNIVIEYNTNLTNIPQRAWDLWPHFKRVQFGISIDAADGLNDYIRYPSNFKKLAENLHKIDTAPGNYRMWIACTVQIYNVGYLTDFIKWILSQNFSKIGKNPNKPVFTTHLLHNPKHLNIKILPKEAKDWIRAKYDDFYPWLENYITENSVPEDLANAYRTKIKKILESYYDMMITDDWSDTLPKFWKYNESLDSIRDERLIDVAPELYEIIKKHV